MPLYCMYNICIQKMAYQGHVTAALIITAFTSTSGRPSAMESLKNSWNLAPNLTWGQFIISTFKFLGCTGIWKFHNWISESPRVIKRFMSKKQGQGLFPLAGIGTCICHLKRKDLTGSHRCNLYVVEIPDWNIYSCNEESSRRMQIHSFGLVDFTYFILHLYFLRSWDS